MFLFCVAEDFQKFVGFFLIFTKKNEEGNAFLALWSIQLFIRLTFTKVSFRLEWNSAQDMKTTGNIS